MNRTSLACAFLASFAAPFLFAQATIDSQIPRLEEKDFVELTELRQSLEKEIPPLQQQVDALNAEIADRDSLEREKDNFERLYRTAGPETPKALKNAYEAQARAAKARLEVAEVREPKTELVKELTQKRAELESKRRQKEKVETRISELINLEKPRQEFKKEMSVYFAILVGLVIVGFFAIAWHDGGVRRTIFSGQAGIQFVTLFSLVISIILFGITGILQDKELSALLGGLSGYILGRGSSANQPTGQGGTENAHPSAP